MIHSCEGSGNGFAVMTYHNAVGTVVSRDVCLYPPPNDQTPTRDECFGHPLDLVELPIGQPWVCCTEDTQQDTLMAACYRDCGHAACQTALKQIEVLASAIDPLADGWLAQLKADLEAYAEILGLPEQQALCADLISDAEGEVATINLHEAPSESGKDEPGHIENLTIYIQCSIDLVEQVPEASVCAQSAHTPDEPEHQDHDGLVFGGASTFSGPQGQGQSDLLDGVVALRVPTCAEEPCTLMLTQLDARFENVQIPGVELTGVAAHLRGPAQGWRSGESLVFPAGALRFDVEARVLLDSTAISEVPGSVLQVSNIQPALGSFTDDGTFALEEATFAAGGYEVVLRVEPSSTAVRLERAI